MSTYAEPMVARVTGIPKRTLVEQRQASCEKGPDWLLMNGVVHYTEAGLAKICAKLRLDQAGLRWPEETVPAPAGAPGPTSPSEPEKGGAEASASTDEAATLEPGTLSDAVNGPAEPAPATESGPSPVTAAVAIANGVDHAPDPVEVTLTEVPVRGNTTLLYGTVADPEAPSGRRRVVVRVRDNRFFLRGFVVRATPAKAGHFNFVGRLPRWRGDRLGFTARPQRA